MVKCIVLVVTYPFKLMSVLLPQRIKILKNALIRESLEKIYFIALM
ncbi:hypothetical protein BPTFM16_02749 [Altererythrobacter insulae]|nr:hypothetical protein BPTFM16_02749 [Altererythrobacter insulae]